MPDSNAVRSSRKRAHAAGDHSQCRPGCQRQSRGVVSAVPRIPQVPAGPAGNLDASASMRRLAARLEAAHEADPSNANVARELRATLLVLGGAGGGQGGKAAPDIVDAIRASWESGA